MQQVTLTSIGGLLNADPTVTEETRRRVMACCKQPERPRRRRLGTVRQAAEILGVHRRTIQRYAREGNLTAIYQSRRRVRYDLDEVERLASEGIQLWDGEA